MSLNIETLNIITPFKNTNNKNIIQTIESLIKISFFIKVNHFVIYDITSSKILAEIKNKLKSHKNKNFKFRTIKTATQGIYSAINIGLDQIKDDSYYLVLGEGDLLKKRKQTINIKKSNIVFIDYELSKGVIKKKFREMQIGMPYCHNAIIFKKNNLRYCTNYKIAADYEYLIKYLKEEKLKLKQIQKNYFYDCLLTVFESEKGISSNSKFKKSIENFIITIRNKGILGAIKFLLNYFKKFIEILLQ